MNGARLVRSTALCVSTFLFAAGSAPLAGQQKPVPAADPLERVNESIDALTRKVWPSVVQIHVTSYGAREDRTPGEASVIGRQRSVGSGFVVDPDGFIMTNAHVVANAQRVQILLPPAKADGSLETALSPRMNVMAARIVGISSELDIALLKVDGLKLPALELATYSTLRQGETVFAFGSPAGLRQTLTHGMVSAVARQIDPDSPLIYVQTDAPINPGNSGGPLVNVRGQVVGMNTFIVSESGGSDGLGFAIPSATVRTALRQLKQFGQLRRQEMGLSLQTITPEMAEGLHLARDHGVIISDVWPRGPAEAAGLKPGDILISVDGQPAENLPTVNYNFRLRESSDPVQLVIQRGSTEAKFSVIAVEQKSEFDSVAALADPQKNLVAELGILGVEIDPRMVDASTGLRDPYGIVVAARTTGPLTEVPLLPRDVIRSLNDAKMFTLEQLRNALRAMKPGSAVTLQVQRDGRLLYVSFTLD
jgi:serine protease Do